MTSVGQALLLLSSLGVWEWIEQFRRTSHGQNPWSVDALLNVLATYPHAEHARRLVDGAFTSIYRSPDVNRRAGGVETSLHLRGLAWDIKPRMISPHDAAGRVYEAAVRGELGAVDEILEEPTVVHVGFRPPGSPRGRVQLGKWRM